MIKKLLKELTISTIIIILMTAALSNFAGAIEWHSEPADTGKQYTEGLGYDALGQPGIAQMDYDSNPNKAVYRYKSASGWVSEVLGDAYCGPALAYNALGQPSMLYLNSYVNPHALIYAKRISENNWAQETVATVGDYSSSYSLAFNSNNYPCFTYVDGGTLYYVEYNGSSWQKQAVRTADDIGSPSLAFNGSIPAIAFSDDDAGLQYVYLSDGTWVRQTADPLLSTTYRGRQNFITLRFGNGKPVISYNDQDTKSLKFAYSLDGNWTANTVEASTSGNNETGFYASMQVSQAAGSYVIYLAHSNYVLNGTTAIKLKTLAVNSDSDLTGLGFVSQTLYSSRSFGNITPLLSIGLKDGNPGIAFLNYRAATTTYISMQPKIQTDSSVALDAAASGSSSSREITITNNGSLNLSISEITAPSAPFRITGGDPGTLAPGQSRVINAYFEPTAAGASYSDTLSIKSNDPDNPIFNISLSARSMNNNATLTGLSYSNGSSLTLLPDDTGGSLTVDYATDALSITPAAADTYAQIKIQGASVQSGTASGNIPLQIGPNTVTILVTSEDASVQRTYTLNITRRDSPDASLTGLSVSAGELSPAFSPETTAYSMTLPDGVFSFSFTPTATLIGALGNSTISINAAPVKNGAETGLLTAAVGENTYTIHVLAPDGESTKDYVVTVFRLPEISGLTINHGVLDTAFNPYCLTYKAFVPNSAVTMTVIPASADCTVTVNGSSASSEVDLETGENTIVLRAVSLDGLTERTYALTVTRLPGLTALSVGDTPVMLSENQFDYSVDITDAECPIIFSAPAGMNVEITDISTSEDGKSVPISFQDGANGPYTIKLTNAECVEPTIYTLTVKRHPLLTSLDIAGSTMELLQDKQSYINSVANTCESTEIKVSVNAGTAVVPEGSYSFTPVEGQINTWTVGNLHVGANLVNLRLTSSDNQAETMYSLNIQRRPGLSELSVDGGNLKPDFNVDTYDYTVNVGRETSAVALGAVTSEAGTILSIKGTVTPSGYPSGSIPLAYGSNIIPVVVGTHDSYNIKAVYNINVIRQDPESGTISPTSAIFVKYEKSVSHKDISVTVTSNENPLISLKNGDSTLVEGTDYSVSGNTYIIKKEYLSTLSTGNVGLIFDFTYGADPVLNLTILDFDPAADDGGTLKPPIYQAYVSDGGKIPETVNTGTGAAAVDLGTLSGSIRSGADMVVEMVPIPGANSYTANIPSSSLSASDGGYLTLNTNLGSITIPGGMLSSTSLTGEAGVTIGEDGKENLPDDVKSVIGDRRLIQLMLSIDGMQTEWSNPDAPVTVSVPYTPTPEELKNPEGIVVWYIDGSGNHFCITSGRYNPETGMVSFNTTHFSDYAVVYNPVEFHDVNANAWYYKAVNYLAAREITNGTGDGDFSPNAKLTRGEFIVLLMRAYGIEPDTNSTDNFSDAGNTYYTGYLAAAKRLGITTGVGNNQYAPENEITRQEMFTLLYNALKVIGQLPQGSSGKTLSDYTDAGQIDSWANDAMTLLVETGTVGGNNGALTPLSTTSRAEMAQVLYNLLGK